jgi:DNA-directed RNA polymerase subunit K/omega
MSKLKRSLTSSLNPWVETKNTTDIKNRTGNLYESIAVIAKRANQINISVKEELHSKLEEFASHTDNLEEVHENKEQIEISGYPGYPGIPGQQNLFPQERRRFV